MIMMMIVSMHDHADQLHTLDMVVTGIHLYFHCAHKLHEYKKFGWNNYGFYLRFYCAHGYMGGRFKYSDGGCPVCGEQVICTIPFATQVPIQNSLFGLDLVAPRGAP